MAQILCVDDESNQLMLYRFTFERAGFTVLSACNGQEGVDMAHEHKPDIILMDLMMPIKDGRQAAREIKTTPDLAHIPVVLFTAYREDQLPQEAKESGADAILPKSLSPLRLLEQVQKLLDP